MKIQPASIDQVRQTERGHMVAVSSHGIATELARLDKGLKLRFADPPGRDPYWVIYHEKHDDCPHNGTDDEYLVLTAKAFQNKFGVWEGIDMRAIRRLEEIRPGGRGDYDYAKELERANLKRQADAKRDFENKVGEAGELAAFRTRKDIGERYKGRAFIPDDLPPAA